MRVLPALLHSGEILAASGGERQRSRAVNPTLYRRAEFGTTLRARDHVLTAALDGAMR